MHLRSTTIIAPLASARRLAPRSSRTSGALRGMGIGAALLFIGFAWLLTAPIVWCVRRVTGLLGRRA